MARWARAEVNGVNVVKVVNILITIFMTTLRIKLSLSFLHIDFDIFFEFIAKQGKTSIHF